MKSSRLKSKVTINWNVEDDNWSQVNFNAKKIGNEVILKTLDYLAFRYIMPDLELSILLTNDESIQKLNSQFRGKDKPTNVLSFPGTLPIPSTENLYLGDIAISLETLESECKAQKKTIQNHYSHLLIHSVLHLLGHDHENENEAMFMESIEKSILFLLKIRDPYEQ